VPGETDEKKYTQGWETVFTKTAETAENQICRTYALLIFLQRPF
jgi:hypothetical protein